MKNFFTLFFIIVFLSATSFAQQIEKQILDRNGNPTFVEFDTKAKAISKSETKNILSNLLNTTKNDEFKSFQSEKDQIGFTHEKLQQYYKGVKVENGVYIVHSRNDIIKSISGEYKVIKDINTEPSITAERAEKLAKSFIDAQKYIDESEKKSPIPELVIVASDYGKHPKAKYEMVLAYKIDVYAIKPLSRDWVYVDAHAGEIVHVNARIKNANATGTADTRYSGTKSISTDSYNNSYRLRDYSRGNGIITYDCNTSTSYSNAVDFTDANNNWTSSEYNNSAKDNGALDAHWAGMVTYDYFKNIHGRNSFNGNGAQIKTYVHYDYQYENAFWNGSVFTFGDGASTFDILTSLDIFAHEFGHAVCSYTCNLTYSREPGALNEAFSDIWGSAVEYHYAPEKDTWLMGEDIGYVLRSLSDPKSRNLPDTYLGENWVTSSADYYGVHTNNGPFCYWFYLISVGGNGTNDNNDTYDVTGIGIEKAEKIAYRIESVYMTSSSDYADARTYAIEAAQDLYGEGSQEEISVTNAMYAVGVGEPYSGTTPDPSSYCTSKGTDYSYEWITEVQVGEFSKTSSGSGYSDFTSSVIEVNAGQSYNITLTPGFASSTYDEYWKIWIDYNNDTTFTSDELAFDAGALSSSAVSGTITIPGNVNGIRRIRVSMKYNGGQDACETFQYGEVEDYHINISQSAVDNEAPTAPSNLTSSNVTETTVDLSWNESTDNVGVTGYEVYQNGSLLGSVVNNSANVTGLTAGTTYNYYVKAKDAAGNVSGASNTISVTTLSDNIEYCQSQGNNSSYEWIDLVELNEMSNPTGNNGGYADFTNLTATVSRGAQQTIYVSCGFSGSSYTEYWHIWIDWNQNGTFESGERMVYGSSSSANKLSATFTVPSDAQLGTTRMRVTMKYNAAATACESFSYGEVEDYTINVTTTGSYTFASFTDATDATELGKEIPTGIEVYPNPAKDNITVSVNNGNRTGTINIYNMTGLIKVVEIDGTQKDIDISNLPSGSYIISIEDERDTQTKQIIKE